MTKFVQCIDARDSDGALQHGAIYPVVASYGSFIAIEAGPLKGWFRSRFKPAPNIDGLPLDAKAETEEEGGETETDGPPTTIKPAEVSRPQGVQTSQAPGGTVHMLPDRRAAAPNT